MPESSDSADKDAKKITNTDIFLYLASSRHYVLGGSSPQIIRTYITVARSLGLLKEKDIPFDAYNSKLLPGERTAWYALHKKRMLESIAVEVPTPLERSYVVEKLRTATNTGKRAADLVGLLYECNGNAEEANDIEDTFTDPGRINNRHKTPPRASTLHSAQKFRNNRNKY